MKDIGLRIDDVAWIIGRTEAVQYTAKNGEIDLENQLLGYTIQINTAEGIITLGGGMYDAGILFFNVPLSKYYLDNTYYEDILPTKTENLVSSGTTATVTRVFAIQKNPLLNQPEYIRVVVAPTIRYLPSSISLPGETGGTYYVRLYLPNLVQRKEPAISQTLTLNGENLRVARHTIPTKDIYDILINISFPKKSIGFDNTFFHFPNQYLNSDNTLTQKIQIPKSYSQTVVELYTSDVQVGI